MDKIDRLFDAMEHPEHFSSAEIEEMLHDPEVKEAFDLLDKTKSSLQSIDIPDIEDEWKTFENNHRQYKKSRHRWPSRFFSRNAAASIAIGIASFTAVAAIVGVGINRINNNRSEATPDVKTVAGNASGTSQPDTVKAAEIKKEAAPEIILFDEETFETIINRIATYYDYKVVFNNNATKTLRLYFRWNQALPLEDVVESLNNFEQINLSIKDKNLKID